MAYVDFVMKLHAATRRDYIERVVSHDKAESAEVALKWGPDYWDGDRRYGYGGMRYDGRWRTVAQDMAKHYHLKPGARILDVGCGKGYLLYEFTQVVPDAEVAGIDISRYALEDAKDEVKQFLKLGDAVDLPWPDNYFDFVVSVTTLHNLHNYDLDKALKEIERVARGPKHVIIESYRNEHEKANLLYWQLTCRSFYTPREWEWFFQRAGYSGDYSYIVFE
jgi:protein-L-isoaspartate(D-aspartate) O-methyltransferase